MAAPNGLSLMSRAVSAVKSSSRSAASRPRSRAPVPEGALRSAGSPEASKIVPLAFSGSLALDSARRARPRADARIVSLKACQRAWRTARSLDFVRPSIVVSPKKNPPGLRGDRKCWLACVLSDAATPPEEMNDKENHSQNDEQMDEASRYVKREKPKSPKDKQNDSDC